MKTAAWTLVLPSVLVLSVGGLALAREQSEARVLTTQLGVLRKAADSAGLVDALGEAPSVYKRSGVSAEKAKLRGELGKIAKQRDLGPARAAAVRALVDLGDPAAAWKEVSSLMPAAKVAEASELDLAVIKAAGGLAQGKAAKPLLALVVKAKDAALATAAAEALGGFGAAPKTRVTVLKDLMAAGAKLADAATASGKGAVPAAERWSAVGPAVVRGLNGLTGRDLSSFEDWRALYEKDRSAIETLFLGRDE